MSVEHGRVKFNIFGASTRLESKLYAGTAQVIYNIFRIYFPMLFATLFKPIILKNKYLGRYLASGGSDEKIFIWDYSTKNKIEIAANQKGGVVGVEWLSQSMILSSGADSSFITWKLPFE